MDRRGGRVRGITLLLAALASFAACTRPDGAAETGESKEATIQRKSIQDVQREHTPRLMAMPGVVGTGVGERDGAPCIVVFVVELSPQLNAQLPDSLEGYPVDIRVSGEIHARPDPGG